MVVSYFVRCINIILLSLCMSSTRSFPLHLFLIFLLAFSAFILFPAHLFSFPPFSLFSLFFPFFFLLSFCLLSYTHTSAPCSFMIPHDYLYLFLQSNFLIFFQLKQGVLLLSSPCNFNSTLSNNLMILYISY